MATIPAPAITWTGSEPPQSQGVRFANVRGQAKIANIFVPAPKLSDWVVHTSGTSAFPLN